VSFFQELLHGGLYKKNQGRITRQVTWGSIALAVLLGCWRFSETISHWGDGYWWVAWMAREEWRLGIPTVLCLLGTWMAYRLVNMPGFADFLIAVEAEMNKVSWPSKAELYRASLVVLFVIFALAAVLFLFDAFWSGLFRGLGIL
jgi:preprotein translocase subunit SecE